MDSLTVTYIVVAVAGAIALSLFAIWIFAPAWMSYGRTWERFAAAALSVFILAAFIGTGIATGSLVVFYWDEISGLFP
ncbi:MAG: hypothetical protein WDZ37_04945 [Solirubrobacterales bacterium]